MRVILVIVTCMLICSCALGVGVYTAGVKTQNWDRVCVRSYVTNDACDDKASILKKLGKPSFVENSDGSEIWKYRTGLKYTGFAPVIILIPIPIMLPVGFRYGYIYFDKNGVITNAKKEFNCQKNHTYLGLWVTGSGSPNEGFGYLKPRNGDTCPD
jgi:hypothetical protein